MNKTPLYDSWCQQEDDNGILLQLLKAKVSTDESAGIRILDCDKNLFRQEEGCVIARDGDRIHNRPYIIVTNESKRFSYSYRQGECRI